MTTTADRVLVLHHSEGGEPGWLGDALELAGVSYLVVRLGAGEPLPSSIDWKAVVVLGGAMGAYEEADYPFLVGEKEFIAKAVGSDIPVLGICLGSQLIADALGGRAYKGPHPEGGLFALNLTEAGRADPLMASFPDRVLVAHGDTFDLPPGAELLAQTELYQHAYRVGSAVAVQSHPEAWLQLAEVSTSRPGGGDIAASGVDPQQLLAEMRAGEDVQREQALRFFATWIDSLT